MSIRSRLGTALVFLVAGAAVELPFLASGAPTWSRYLAVGIAASPLVAVIAFVGYVVAAGIASRVRDRKALRVVHNANDIQVLGTFLSDGEDDAR